MLMCDPPSDPFADCEPLDSIAGRILLTEYFDHGIYRALLCSRYCRFYHFHPRSQSR